MLINHDNYETIFLMYVDNELSAEERRAVDEFVNANEHLRDELEVLQSTVLLNEDAVFVPKTQLYKNASPVESVQESLLLMLDNELGDTYKNELLQQMNDSKEVKEEWSLLQRTVLDKNDTVVFTEKRSLYRHTTRVISMRVWRVAAAILIALGLLTGITLYNNSQSSDGFVQTTPVTTPTTKPVENTQTQPLVEEQEALAVKDKAVEPNKNTASPVHRVSEPKGQLVNNKSRETKEHIKGRNNVPTSQPQTILAKQDNVIEKNTVRPANNNEEIVVTESPVKEEITTTLIDDSDVGRTRHTFARLAVNEEDPDRFLNIEEDKVTRTKLGGIIRQVKRVVERNTKIKTSNGLRIGGFEIAIK